MKNLSVPRTIAQEARLALVQHSFLDTRYKILEKNDRVYLPLLREPPSSLAERYLGVVVEEDNLKRDVCETPMEIIRNLAKEALPDDSLRLLPAKWEKIGDVVCLRIPSELKKMEERIASLYAKVLNARAVVDYGHIEGVYRKPSARVIWGPVDSKELVTTHLENGIKYKMDVLGIMFSSGNIDERIRMASLACAGECVVDMFAGIGYFTLPVAVYGRAEKILAYEINPHSHGFLVENCTLNSVSSIVDAIKKDNRECPPGVADRVIMGYVGTTHLFLEKAISIMKEDGGWIHYHETCPNELLPERPLLRLKKAGSSGGFSICSNDIHVIKSYSPGVSHVVVDAFLG